jgi:hypothetical protein
MTSRSRLHVIEGEGQAVAGRPPTGLLLLRHLHDGPPQVSLPLVTHSTKTLFSVGIEAVEAESFAALIRSLGVTCVCDVRVSPSFRGRGGTYHSADTFGALADVRYCHLQALANKYNALSWNEAAGLERYASELMQNPEIVGELGKLIGHGPVVLLGRAPDHYHSERAVLCNILSKLGFEYALVIGAPGL